MSDPDNHEFPDTEAPSKSARKREMTELQTIGERLTRLPTKQLARIPIDDPRLRDAVELARRIRDRSGLRRQLQYIGKLMRDLDSTPIREALDALDRSHRADTAEFHRLEALRDTLLEQGDQAIGEVLTRYPHADRSHLRQLLRQHDRNAGHERLSQAGRQLFRYLRELDESGPEV